MLETRRITEGIVIATGEHFTIVDDYGDPASAHRVLPNAWRGTTTFTEKKIEIVDNLPKFRWADVDGDSEAEVTASMSAPGAAETPLYSLCARPPAPAGVLVPRVSCDKRRGFRCGFSGGARTESVGSHHLGGKSDCKFESLGPRSGLGASDVPTANCVICQVPISSPASSRWIGDVRGGVRESHRQISHCRRWHVQYGHIQILPEHGGQSYENPSQTCPLQSGSSETEHFRCAENHCATRAPLGARRR